MYSYIFNHSHGPRVYCAARLLESCRLWNCFTCMFCTITWRFKHLWSSSAFEIRQGTTPPMESHKEDVVLCSLNSFCVIFRLVCGLVLRSHSHCFSLALQCKGVASVLNGSKLRSSTSCCCQPFCFIIRFHSNDHPWKALVNFWFPELCKTAAKFLKRLWGLWSLFNIHLRNWHVQNGSPRKPKITSEKKNTSNLFNILSLTAKMASAFLSTRFKMYRDKSDCSAVHCTATVLQWTKGSDYICFATVHAFRLFYPKNGDARRHRPKEVRTELRPWSPWFWNNPIMLRGNIQSIHSANVYCN